MAMTLQPPSKDIMARQRELPLQPTALLRSSTLKPTLPTRQIVAGTDLHTTWPSVSHHVAAARVRYAEPTKPEPGTENLVPACGRLNGANSAARRLNSRRHTAFERPHEFQRRASPRRNGAYPLLQLPPTVHKRWSTQCHRRTRHRQPIGAGDPEDRAPPWPVVTRDPDLSATVFQRRCVGLDEPTIGRFAQQKEFP